MDEGRVHSPAARDCLRCHASHAVGEAKLLAKPVRQLCAECHDVTTETFSVAHVRIDPSIMRCERCHDAHASTQDHFFKPNMHAPFAMKTCTDCHLAIGRSSQMRKHPWVGV